MGIDTNPQLAPEGHADWLAKGQIAQARQPAALAINAELVQLYARIGRDVLQCQQAQGWGAKVIERLALGLNEAFPDRRGSWSSNLKHLRLFARHCPDGQLGQQPADQLPRFPTVTLLTRLDSMQERAWYATQALQHGWSRTRLAAHI